MWAVMIDNFEARPVIIPVCILSSFKNTGSYYCIRKANYANFVTQLVLEYVNEFTKCEVAIGAIQDHLQNNDSTRGNTRILATHRRISQTCCHPSHVTFIHLPQNSFIFHI